MVNVFVVHGLSNLFDAVQVEKHAQDLLAIGTQLGKMLVKKGLQLFLQQGIFVCFGFLDQQGLVPQLLCMKELLPAFLDPDASCSAVLQAEVMT